MNRRSPCLSRDTYYPLDEMLEVPRVRILRTLTHFDTASSDDLRIALDVEDSKRAWNALANNLRNLVDDGSVTRTGEGNAHRYSINDRGRQLLAKLLARGTVTAEAAS